MLKLRCNHQICCSILFRIQLFVASFFCFCIFFQHFSRYQVYLKSRNNTILLNAKSSSLTVSGSGSKDSKGGKEGGSSCGPYAGELIFRTMYARPPPYKSKDFVSTKEQNGNTRVTLFIKPCQTLLRAGIKKRLKYRQRPASTHYSNKLDMFRSTGQFHHTAHTASYSTLQYRKCYDSRTRFRQSSSKMTFPNIPLLLCLSLPLSSSAIALPKHPASSLLCI